MSTDSTSSSRRRPLAAPSAAPTRKPGRKTASPAAVAREPAPLPAQLPEVAPAEAITARTAPAPAKAAPAVEAPAKAARNGKAPGKAAPAKTPPPPGASTKATPAKTAAGPRAPARTASEPATPTRKTPARKPAAASQQPEYPDVPIWQIHYEASQREKLDPAFMPLDNAGDSDLLREFVVFERLAHDDLAQRATLWGALSWRFGDKTGLSGSALRAAIAAQPGMDLYYCNPYPENEALYANGWHQGLPPHPGFLKLCTAVFQAAGLDQRELHAIQPSQAFSTCNYFVGSPAFWNAYLPWIRGVVERARAGVPAATLQLLDSSLSDPKRRHANSSYWPFIIERLLPQFLCTAQAQGLKVHKLKLPVPESRMNAHLLRLREMKDVAHRTRSPWMLSCWLNYRNLYLLQTAGARWCEQFLGQLPTPPNPEFW